jgi:leader peptidase (prepilin peptidase)/N-methyltransferase
MIRILGTIFVGLVGLAFGSFLNVCLNRWPEEESVVKPRSHCRDCDHILDWWENIPLFSWIVLRGRCRSCHHVIGWRYPLVEFSVGVLWAIQAWKFLSLALSPELATHALPTRDLYQSLGAAIIGAILYWLLVALATLDAEQLWLPDRLTLPGLGLAFAWVALSPALQKLESGYVPKFTLGFQIESAAIGALIDVVFAAGLVLLIRWVYQFIRQREGIGMGDAKLMALLAAWLGLPGALLAFALGALLGALGALALLAVPGWRRGSASWAASKLPLGTCLAIGGIVSSLWGQPIIAAYLHWAGI